MAPELPYLTILIVIYNELPQTSAATQAVVDLIGVASAAVIVWDNSKASQASAFQAFFSANDCAIDYIHTPENLPLSVIYNSVADKSDRDFLLILDQDTVLPREYLQIFAKAYGDFPDCKLFVPTIRTGDRLISPSPYFAGWGRSWRTARTGLHSTRHMTIINSGLFASLALFRRDGVRYNENLKLYGTDTEFFRTYARAQRQFCILPTVIRHHLSFDDASIASKAIKLQQMFAANRVIYRGDGVMTRALVRCVEAVVRLRYTWRYRSFAFLARGF